MVNLKNKQTFYHHPVGAVSNRTGSECPIDSKVYHSRLNRGLTQISRKSPDKGD